MITALGHVIITPGHVITALGHVITPPGHVITLHYVWYKQKVHGVMVVAYAGLMHPCCHVASYVFSPNNMLMSCCKWNS